MGDPDAEGWRLRVEGDLRTVAERLARLEGDARVADKVEAYVRERFDRVEHQLGTLKVESTDAARISRAHNRQIFLVVFTIVATQLAQFVLSGGLNVPLD